MSYTTKRLDERVIRLLEDGAIGFMPSDTIYGLSCRALNEQAVERLHALKDRDSDKPFIVLIAGMAQLSKLGIETAQAGVAKKYWPGQLSLICEAPKSPLWLHRGTKTLAVRVPDNNELRRLLERVGPLVSTSANQQGEPPVNDSPAAREIFGDSLDFYVDAGSLGGHQPSTLIRMKNGKPEIIRPGAVKIDPEGGAE